MPAWQRTYIVTCFAAIGYCLTYMVCDFAKWPKFTYFPYERTWELTTRSPGGVPMAYLGIVFWGLVGGLFAGTAAWIASRYIPRPLPHRWTTIIGAWTITAFVFSGSYFTWNLWPF